MTAAPPMFATFTAPEPTSEEDRFSAKDNIGHVIVVKVNERRDGIVTANSPGGTSAVACDVADLDNPGGPRVYRDTLIFGGAMVDALAPFVGQMVVVKLESRKSNSGRTYPAPVEAMPPDLARASSFFVANPAVFAPVMNTVAPNTAAAWDNQQQQPVPQVVQQPPPWAAPAQQTMAGPPQQAYAAYAPPPVQQPPPQQYTPQAAVQPPAAAPGAPTAEQVAAMRVTGMTDEQIRGIFPGFQG